MTHLPSRLAPLTPTIMSAEKRTHRWDKAVLYVFPTSGAVLIVFVSTNM